MESPEKNSIRAGIAVRSAAVSKVLESQLVEWGYSFVLVDIKEQMDCDLLFLDVAFANAIENLAREYPLLPIIVVTSRPRLKEAMNTIRYGTFDCIVLDEIHLVRRLVYKEVQSPEVLDPLRHVLGRAALRVTHLRSRELLLRRATEEIERLKEEQEFLFKRLESQASLPKLPNVDLGDRFRTFVAGVGNEINNPLVGLLANLEVLQEWSVAVLRLREVQDLKLSHEAEQLVSESVEHAQRIQAVVRALQQFNQQSHIRSETIELGSFFQSLKADTNFSDVTFATTGAPTVVGQRNYLRTILKNLVDNARESYADDAQSRPIRVVAAIEAGEVRLAVEDCGLGMDDDERSRAFDPFFTTKKLRQASGLGLSLAMEFALRLGGQLTLEPNPPQGTRAVLSLPTGALSESET